MQIKYKKTSIMNCFQHTISLFLLDAKCQNHIVNNIKPVSLCKLPEKMRGHITLYKT